MLNIAGISSAPESIPSNSWNSIDTQHKRPTQDWSSSTDFGISGTGSNSEIPRNSGIANRNHTILLTHICDVVLISYFIWTRSNFGTEFRESRNSGYRGIPGIVEFRNWTEFRGIPSDSGIANRNHTILFTHIFDVVLISYFIWTRCNFGTEFRESRNSFLFRESRNSFLFRESRNSFLFRKLTELDQLSSACRMLCVDRVPGIERNRFRCGIGSWNVQHCGIGWLLQKMSAATIGDSKNVGSISVPKILVRQMRKKRVFRHNRHTF
jgi:hypothetical protein